MQNKWEKSEADFQKANKVLVGGVNSPVRAFKSVGRNPVFIEEAKGATVTDVDGNCYIDYVGSWGPAIIGHGHPEVMEAVAFAAKRGFSFGAPCELETELAQKICDIFPSIDKVRLVSSGTEACMSALRLARAYSGKNKFIKFAGCYHGHADPFLVQAGSGVATFGLPNSPGVPEAATKDTLVAKFNDISSVEKLFERYPNEIGAIFLEPFMGNGGFIKGDTEFLVRLREICDETGALLIFDEVMTGFRVDWGGVQTLLGIKPDLTTLGKVVGGGMPLAVYGGRADIMNILAPQGSVYQAGTLSGNPLAVACGLKTLEVLEKLNPYKKLEELSAKLMSGFSEVADEFSISFASDNCGGMFGFFFTSETINSYEDVQIKADMAKFSKFFQGMFEKGIYLAPSGFEAGFISTEHTSQHIEDTIAAAKIVMQEL